MPNILEYTLSLQDKMSAKLRQIGINSDESLTIFSELQKQSLKVSKAMGAMGTSVGTLAQKLELLKREKQWIPAGNEKDIRRYNKEIQKLESQINRLNTINGSRLKKWFTDLKAQVPMLSAVTNPIALIGVGVYKLSGYLQASAAAYKEESVQVTKLQQIMQNTMGATGDQVKSILDLASAQQKLGVIGDETQLSGAQELATYLTKKESLEKLMPAMNDMLAQQYGLNATQEQATTIAQMMGKVLDGQVGALSRYGYRFTEAQEKVLKLGNEQERVAMLSEVVAKYVGGVNEALAQTPEGKLKNAANNMGDLQERVGGLYISIQAALIPLKMKIMEIIDKIVRFFEQNKEKILAITGAIAGVLGTVFGIIWDAISIVGGLIGWVVNLFQEFFGAINAGSPLAIALAVGIGAVTVALSANWLMLKKNLIATKAKAAWDKITVFWNNIQTASWWKLNAAILANPIGWIIGLIAALVAGVIIAWNKFEWFRGAVYAAWEAIKGFGIMIKDYVIDRIKGLLSGIAGIGGALVKLFKGDFAGAWEQAKEAVGDLIGVDAAKNAVKTAMETGKKVGAAYQKGVADFHTVQEKAGLNNGISDPVIPGAVDPNKTTPDIPGVTLLNIPGLDNPTDPEKKDNYLKLIDVIDGNKSQLGITPPNIPGSENPANPKPKAKPDPDNTTETIAAGGTKNTTITINFGRNLVESINISKEGGFKENAKDMTDQVLDQLTRVLTMAQANAV